MRVREVMTAVVVTVGPGHTLREAARRMAERNVGSALVTDPDGAGPGILTERDILRAVARGVDPDRAQVGDHAVNEVRVASPDWTLEEAAAAMLDGGFRHLVVVEHDRVVGIVSMRDLVRGWVGSGTRS